MQQLLHEQFAATCRTIASNYRNYRLWDLALKLNIEFSSSFQLEKYIISLSFILITIKIYVFFYNSKPIVLQPN